MQLLQGGRLRQRSELRQHLVAAERAIVEVKQQHVRRERREAWQQQPLDADDERRRRAVHEGGRVGEQRTI